MKIDPYAHLVALARQQASRAGPAIDASRKSIRTPAGGDRASSAEMGRTIVERIREIAPDDPRRRRKAFRVFLESVLAEEFGATLITDPGYQRLVDTVQEQMEKEPSLAAPMARAIDLLLG
jgi:hypothetical protein